MRLIDADEFENFVRKHCEYSLADLWCELIRRQPTAIDLDKVVEQLQDEVKQSEDYAQNFEDNGMYLESEEETKVKIALERAIGIVKKGGIA